MNLIPVKTQHEGESGHWYVERTKVVTSGAGIPELFCGSDTLVCLDDYGHLVLESIGQRVRLTISARDRAKIERLLAQRDEACKAISAQVDLDLDAEDRRLNREYQARTARL